LTAGQFSNSVRRCAGHPPRSFVAEFYTQLHAARRSRSGRLAGQARQPCAVVDAGKEAGSRREASDGQL